MSDNRLSKLDDYKRGGSNTSVVESYVEAVPQVYDDLGSTVQVTLAKRILLAGSNQVFCLGASTSVPINPDERASQSDLALRLSDGTNVALSLSFFNDDYGNVVPMTANELNQGTKALSRAVTFEPLRYSTKDDGSKLGAVLVTMAFTGVLALYLILPGSVEKVKQYFHFKEARPALATASIVPHNLAKAKTITHRSPVRTTTVNEESAQQVVPSAKPQTAAPENKLSVPIHAKNVHEQLKRESTNHFNSIKHTVSRHTAQVPKAESFESEAPRNLSRVGGRKMFIPPPPPTDFAMPPPNSPYWTYGMPPNMVLPAAATPPMRGASAAKTERIRDDGAAIKPAIVHKESPVKTQRESKEISRKANDLSVRDAAQDHAAAQERSAPSMSIAPRESVAPSLSSVTSRESAKPFVSSYPLRESAAESHTNTHGTAGAPAPGGEPGDVSLERIVPPGQ